MEIITYVIQVLEALPALISAGIDVEELISDSNAALKLMKKENRDPTGEEWNTLDLTIENLRAQLPDVTE